MRTILTAGLFIFISSFSYSQCFVIATGGPAFCGCTGIAVATGNGVPPFTYLWMPGNMTGASVSGLCAGTYTVTLTDASACSTSTTVTIAGGPPITSITATGSPSTSCTACDGSGSVTNIIGGTLPYSYNWSTFPSQNTATATGLCPGTYTVIVTDANGCSITDTVMVSGNMPLQAIITCSSSCTGTGFATVNVLGGQAPYTYNWMPGNMTTQTVTGLSAGCYTVTITDAGSCTVTATCCVVVSPSLVITTSIAPATCGQCNGIGIAIATGGMPPYVYSWPTTPPQTGPTATGLCAGTYTLVVTDANGCSGTTVYTVTGTSAVTATTSTTNASCQTCCTGTATVNPSGGTAPYTYTWTSTPPQFTQTATGLCPGTYTVCVTDINLCSVCTTVTVNYNSGFDDDPIFSGISLFPNPSPGNFTIEFPMDPEEKVLVEAFEISGRKVFTQIHKAAERNVSFSFISLDAGTYLVKIHIGEKWVARLVQKL